MRWLGREAHRGQRLTAGRGSDRERELWLSLRLALALAALSEREERGGARGCLRAVEVVKSSLEFGRLVGGRGVAVGKRELRVVLCSCARGRRGEDKNGGELLL